MPYSYEQDNGSHINVTLSSPETSTHEAHYSTDVISASSEILSSSANKWIILALAASSSFMTTLDGSIINIGLPTIARTFHTGISGSTEWIIIGYLVIIAATLLTFGRLADILGRKTIFLAGLVVFVLGSALCGLAPSLLFLIIARLFQGIGSALVFCVNIAMITSSFPGNKRGLALGLNAVVVSLGVALGPTLGGIITQYLTWRWIFYVNVPVSLLIILATWRFYHEPHSESKRHERFDPLGALVLAIALAALTLGLSFGQEWGWGSAETLLAFGTGIVMLGLAVLVESHVAHPILNLELLTNRTFVFANISFMLCMMALFAPGFLLPFYFEQLRGFSTVQTGLLLTPLPITFAIAAPLSGALADRLGSRWLSPVGLGIACFGLFLLGQINAQSTPWDILWRLAVTGIGQGIFQSPNTRTMMGAAPLHAQGEASGLLATGRVIGQSLSVALTGTVFASLGAHWLVRCSPRPSPIASLHPTSRSYSIPLSRVSTRPSSYALAAPPSASSLPWPVVAGNYLKAKASASVTF
ncbi:MFS transporter [Ktedonobacter sp. SOSP1-85]|uniref:MFS transporter n=1 Tax=Ktedonobacter sp. SOSP1-85 TaxID=2778367 RepID=UPI001914F245|nr:MFS transporter [Ktedonobacter sp. SOSP1-85]GHO81688.1 MFS transporter [Ktedonobacter sp. SOSP1-85]